MKIKEPITYQDKVYDEYSVSLTSGMVAKDVDYSTSANFCLTPMRINEFGVVELMPFDARDAEGNLYTYIFNTSDIRNCGDWEAISTFLKINTAITEFAIMKGKAKAE